MGVGVCFRTETNVFHVLCCVIQRKARIFVALLLVIQVMSVSLVAQNAGKIAGVVTDARTGEALIGCNVVIVGTTLGASTDLEGSFFILNVPPGRYDLQASLIGYQTVIQEGAIVHAGRTTTTDFRLPETVLEQHEVVIQATRPDVEREKTSTSAIIRSEEVQTIAGIRNVGDVLTLSAEITDGHFRGGRQGEEYYTLQGMGIVNPLDNSSAFLPIMSAVEEVEVITSGFGAQYGNAQSGVVNISMKEGGSDKWRSRVETRSRAPGRKHFGPSVFDPSANVYLQLLLSGDVWLSGDPNADTPQPYFGSMGSGLTSSYARDTLVQLAVAQALWMQTRRDLNRNYGSELDYSIEASTGGPISKDMRMFIALRSNTEWPVFPTEQPNVERQVMGNIVARLSGTSTFRLSGGLTQETGTVFPSLNSVGGYRRWLWDRITGVDYRKRTNVQVGGRYTHSLSPSTFYEIKLNSLFTNNRLGATPVPTFLPDSAVFGPTAIPWSFILPVENNNSPDALNYQAGHDIFRDERTRTISFDGSITSQITRSHLLNAGIQLNTYLIDVNNILNIRGGSNTNLETYRATPFEAAFFAQDKMEFEGMIANVGLRFDLWSSGRAYFSDNFTPFLLPDTTGRYYPDAAPQEDSPVVGRLQPRVGVSFPVSVNTVFHLNYGSFMQRPSFQYVVSNRATQWFSRPVVLGNPALKPETTNSYDIGVTQALGDGFTLDVSGYYKDVKNLIEQANFTNDRTSELVSTYFNRDYADIRGFRVSLSKRRGALTGSINYQFGVATGKSATVSGAVPLFHQDTTGAISTDLQNVPIRDIVLDFDRTHNLVVSLGYVTEEEWGPQILGGYPLGDMTLSAFSFFRSGRPYTSPSNLKLVNALRAPGEHNTDLKLTKRIRGFFGTTATFYVEVFNLFNNMILNYNYLFSRPTPTNPNLPLSYYERFGIDDPENGIRYWWDKGRQGPFALDQSFLIYGNSPRSFSFGLVIEF
jgi:outer membrane receptor protein involved in Fe transport